MKNFYIKTPHQASLLKLNFNGGYGNLLIIFGLWFWRMRSSMLWPFIWLIIIPKYTLKNLPLINLEVGWIGYLAVAGAGRHLRATLALPGPSQQKWGITTLRCWLHFLERFLSLHMVNYPSTTPINGASLPRLAVDSFVVWALPWTAVPIVWVFTQGKLDDPYG